MGFWQRQVPCGFGFVIFDCGLLDPFRTSYIKEDTLSLLSLALNWNGKFDVDWANCCP